VIEARGAYGVHHMTIRTFDGRCERVAADTLAVSGGWNPNLALSTHLGGRPQWSQDIRAFVPGDVPCGMVVVGAARGTFGLAGALREGAAAGIEAAEATGFRAPPSPENMADDELIGVSAFWHVAESRGEAFGPPERCNARGYCARGARVVRSSFRVAFCVVPARPTSPSRHQVDGAALPFP
jgi:sarcosine oxidase subunit alpha